ncbi:MAG: protein kinase domain-containing protein [Thermoanaerobaculia bacterium]
MQGLLGRGGMGEVFLAWDARLRRRVAIKRIRHDQGLNPAMRQRLLREARAVAGLSHPAVVQVYDLIEDAAGDCIVLEYVEGRTLAAHLAETGSLEPAAAVRLAREIAGGLAAAHAAGIIHRDLKAENVIVTPAGHPKILDFGLAQVAVRATDDYLVTQQGVLLGTFHMMSPEQASGEETDERSDLFSLGVLLYEMLSGRSPFRGSSATETLRKVLSEHPPRVDSVRPGLPGPLGDLVARLLAKEPEARPGSAAEVVRELEAIAASLASSGAPTLVASVSDLPTVVDVPRPAVSQPVARHPGAVESTVGMSVLRRPRYLRFIAVAVLLLAIGTAGFLFLRRQPEPKATAPAAAKTIRVLVMRPEIAGKDERLQVAASGVLTASINALRSLNGIAPVDPSQLIGSPQSTKDLARATGTDEVLFSTLEKVGSGSLARITLRRIDGTGGQVLWADNLDAPIEAQDLRFMAEAVSSLLHRGFPGHIPKPGALALDVRNEDYAAFLEIKQRVDSGESLYQPELTLLDPILEGSPRFLEARLLAASLCHTLFHSTQEIAYLKKAFNLVRQAETLAPEDPRPLYIRFKLEMAGGQKQAAAKTLEEIKSLAPADLQLLLLEANFAEQEGRLEDALASWRLAAERVPSWRNLYSLASLEARTGHLQEARGHLEKILAMSPGNLWALEQRALIELLFGDLGRAGDLYKDLIRRAPQRTYFTNLGAVYVLLGQYQEAIAPFRQALALNPNHAAASVDLADAELALGRTEDARGHYSQALRHLESNAPAGSPLSADSMTRAQCLAHLGRAAEAVTITQEVLQRWPNDPMVLEQAAQVYATVGDRASALVSVKAALAKGVQPRWFELPAFTALRADPEFLRLMTKAPGATPSR